MIAQSNTHGWGSCALPSGTFPACREPSYLIAYTLPEDLIAPSRLKRNRSKNQGITKLHEDLERIGLRRRRQHDLRRTFISLARTDGARKDVLEFITHGWPAGVMTCTRSCRGALLCEEVLRLRVRLPEGKELAFPSPESRAPAVE